MKEVRLRSGRVFMWPGIHAEVGENVRVLAPEARQAFVFTDRKCIPIAKRVALSLYQADFEMAGYAMYPGETRKTLTTALGVFNKMVRKHIQPGSVFVTVGGGVVTELGGFVAATFREGLPLFHVPTTLVAQVDTAIGGRIALNVKDGRNFVAASYYPIAVFSDPTLLESLPRREYLSGLAEVVKYGMIREADLLAFVEENIEGVEARKPVVLEEIISRCATIKAALDEAAAAGDGAILNYGRVVGRALEAAGLYRKITPGDALSVGMEAEVQMAERMGVAPPGVPKVQNRMLKLLDLPTRVRGLTIDRMLETMGLDRNAPDARLRFAFPQSVGDAAPGIDVPLGIVEEGLRNIILPGNRLRAARPMGGDEPPGSPPAPPT